MPERLGKQTIILNNKPVITASAAVVGKKEGDGPLGSEFDMVFDDGTLGENSWEKAESRIHRFAVEKAISKAGKANKDIDLIFAGDLLNQCIGTTFGIKDFGIPFAGLYGACSTMALSLATAGIMCDSGAASCAIASTSSHFCSAEKQFRLPLEYGGQRPPSAQWTATAAGAAVVEVQGNGVKLDAVCFGTVEDKGITDANNMGAAMAPAAAATISTFLNDTKTTPDDYDMILTGDLGIVGSELLIELLKKERGLNISSVHRDCGIMLYNIDEQDVNSGGSGCGCSGSVLCSHIMRRLREKELKRVLFAATGALMSSVSSLQGDTIPSISHAVLLSSE